MKIIKYGKIPEEPITFDKWLLKTDLTCSKCGTIFRVESESDYTYSTYRHIGAPYFIIVDCPHCSKENTFKFEKEDLTK